MRLLLALVCCFLALSRLIRFLIGVTLLDDIGQHYVVLRLEGLNSDDITMSLPFWDIPGLIQSWSSSVERMLWTGTVTSMSTHCHIPTYLVGRYYSVHCEPNEPTHSVPSD